MRVAAGVGIERLRVQMISKGEHHVKRPEALIPFLRWGMVGGGEPVRSATATAVRRCVTMFIPCWPAALDVDAERGRAFGEQLGIAPERCYADYQTLFREEAQRP